MPYRNFIKTIIAPFIFLPILFFGQKNTPSPFYLKTNLLYGYIIEHRNNLGHLVKGHITGAEISLSLPTDGRCLWHCEHNYPEKGVSLFWFNLGNPEQLGDLFALSPYYEIPLLSRPAKWKMHLRLGGGVAYATKHFDPIYNHKNNIISAPFNGFVNVKFLFKHDLSAKYRFDFGVSLAHASNGKVKVPNLGLNLACLNIALVFKSAAGPVTTFERYIDSSTARKSLHELYLITAYGFTEIYPTGSRRFFINSNTFGYYFNRSNKHKFGAGVDVYYNPANIREAFQKDSTVISPSQNIQLGAKIGWAYNIGQFSIPVEQGYYLRTTWRGDGMFYTRIGLRYYTKNNMILSIGLKTHWAKADYFEYGIGYRLPLKKTTNK